MDYYDDEDYPSEPEYPPIIPGELTACLGKAQEMRKECDHLKSTLDKALEKIRLTKRVLDAAPQGA
jgi:hypothetical protein